MVLYWSLSRTLFPFNPLSFPEKKRFSACARMKALRAGCGKGVDKYPETCYYSNARPGRGKKVAQRKAL